MHDVCKKIIDTRDNDYFLPNRADVSAIETLVIFVFTQKKI